MDSLSITQFKEVPLLKQSIELKRKTIDVTCGGYPTLLIDSKTSEHSGGFILQGSNAERQHGARFIYWRTLRETIYLSETCLHRNDLWHEVKIVFKGSPILSVGIDKDVNLFMLIVTTTTFHRIPIKRPSSNDSILLTEQDSVLFSLNEHVITDPINCYNFINNIGQSVPTMATAVHCAGKNCSSFVIATANSLHLGMMSSGGDKPEVKFVKLECQTPSVANFIEQIGSVWSTNRTNQSQVVTMCCITAPNREDQPLLFTVHRDGALRVWLHSGQLLTTEYLSKYTSGSRKDFHSCVSRGSNALVGLYVSFKTFSEFIVLRPTLMSGTESLTLQNVYTILAPTFDLIDFQLCEYNLWTLWCNAKSEMQTLVCELPVHGKMGKMDWQPVATASALDDDLLEQADGTDLCEFYCKRIFNSGLFPPVAIKKTLMMLKQDISGREGSSVIGSMLRLKRDVIACIKRQLRKEQVAMERNGPCDEERLLETSNQLWEKFYRYCVQYSEESSRPIGLFLCEEMGGEATSFAVGLVRKHVVSFIRACDHLEVAFYSTEPQAVDETHNDGTILLISSLKTLEQTLSQDEKLELGNFLQHQQLLAAVPTMQDDLDADMQSQEMMSQSEPEPDAEPDDEDNVQTDDLSQLGAAQHHFIAFDTIRKFGAKKLDLLEAIYSLLDLLTPTSKPNSELLKQAWEENYAGGLSIFTGPHLYSELALETTKQTIELRYAMLRNLFLLQHLVRTMQCDYRNEMVNVMLARLEPRIQTLLRSYQAMAWIANTRLELDWSRGRNEIVSTFPPSQRNTPLTLLQAYARCRLYYKQSREPWHPGSTLDEPLEEIPNCSMLSLTQKANVIITHLSPMHDDFRFGEWLSESALTIHIDNYVELVGDWCPTNRFSRSFIQAKAFLLDGDTFKALDLFLKSHEGVHKERFLLKFICHYANGEKRMVSPYEIPSTYFLQVIRLFELYGAHDVVPVLVEIALKHTLQPERQAMLQNIEFCSYMTLGRYKEAYKSLWENVDPARRKDCLRQLINLLLANGDLGRLMMLPSRGHLKDFTDIIAMNARTSDMEDGLRYDFLYAFFVGKYFMRDAADIAFEGAMRYINENTSREHLQLHFRMLLKCISCLATLPAWRAWVASPMTDNSNNDAQSLSAEPAVLNVGKLQERLTIVQAILCLTKNAEDSKLLASMKPKELVTLLLHRKKYNQALQLAHSSVPAMVPTVYGHLAKACVSASSTSADNTDNSWLHENCLADIPVGKDSASTAWNYLQHMIGNEPEDLAVDAHLAVLNNVVSSAASVPLWLRTWCFEHSPVQLVRIYWSHGFLEDACDCMEELFKKRYFTPGHCHHVAFPLTLYERLYYDLENSPNRSQDTIDRYLRLVQDYL